MRRTAGAPRSAHTTATSTRSRSRCVGPRGDVLAFNCGGPAFVFTEERLRTQVAPALVDMVREVAATIGGRAAVPEAVPA